MPVQYDSKTAPSQADIMRQLQRILSNGLFTNSRRLSRFLEFVVSQDLAGKSSDLKEHTIGIEVFDRGGDYSPQTDPIVRIMAGRLRGRLVEYYNGPGRQDPVLIEIPRGAYVPQYRWTSPHSAAPEPGPMSEGDARDFWVGRDAELSRLASLFRSTCAGAGVVALISGEPGLGKTAVAERFLNGVERSAPATSVARGRCSERLAETDAFVPIYELLDSLMRGDDGPRVREAMKSTAPSWYAQVVPGGTAGTDATSYDRMRREFVRLFEQLTQQQPLAVFLDDLHWADASTCDLLSYLAARIGATRVMVVIAARGPESRGASQYLSALQLALDRAGIAHQLPLSRLTLEDTAGYLAKRFAQSDFPDEFPGLVHERTEGNPLFLTDLLKYLQDRAILQEVHGRWLLTRPLAELRGLIPSGIANMIRVKLDQFAAPDRELLLGAAVQGMEFDSAVLGRVLERDPAAVEDQLHNISTLHGYVEMVEEREFPNGMFSLRYRFTHVFYQNALQAVLAPSRRASYSAQIARTLVEFMGDSARTAAAQIAVLFETGRDPERAAEYFLAAAGNAARVFAYTEAALLCRRGLRSLYMLPESRERDPRELRFSMLLGISLMATEGYAAPDVERTHERSRELCSRLGERRRLISVLWALHTCDVNGCELARSLEVAREMRTLAEELQESASIVESLHAVGTTLAFMGQYAQARRALEEVFERFPAEQHTLPRLLYVMDPYVTSLSMLARLLTLMGRFGDAERRAAESMELASRLSHPPSVAYARFWMGWLAHATWNHAESLPHLEQVMEWGREHSLAQLLEWARLLHGSSLVHLGRVDEGLQELRQSIDAQQGMRSLIERPYCLTLMAEALLVSKRTQAEALALSSEAISFAEQTEDLGYQPETYRVRGELRLADGDAGGRKDIEKALALAAESGAVLLELRAAISLTRVAGVDHSRAAVTSALERFAGDAPVVRQARSLISG